MAIETTSVPCETCEWMASSPYETEPLPVLPSVCERECCGAWECLEHIKRFTCPHCGA